MGVGVEKKPTPSASAGSPSDLPWLERELAESMAPKPMTSTSIKSPVKSPARSLVKFQSSDNLIHKEAVIKIHKMRLDCPEQVMCVLPDTLAKLPLSKYRPDNYYPIEENVTPSKYQRTMRNITPLTLKYTGH